MANQMIQNGNTHNTAAVRNGMEPVQSILNNPTINHQ